MNVSQLSDTELYKISGLAICIGTHSEGTGIEFLSSKIVDLCLNELANRSESKKKVTRNSNGGIVIQFNK